VEYDWAEKMNGIKTPSKASWTSSLGRCFEIDLRALAWLRIAIGAILLYDLVGRVRDYQALYSDGGVLSRTLAISQLGRLTGISLHLISGEIWFQAGLFLIAFAAACCMVVGYKTRAATVVSWILFVSICSRNARVMNAGDALMHTMLLWSCFLPLGARHSLDAVKGPARFSSLLSSASAGSVSSVASAATLIQIACIYFATSVLKTGEAWKDGTALYYALNVDQFTTPIGKALLQYPGFLSALTHSTILLEFFGPFLLLWPLKKKFIRTAMVACFVSLHIGIMLTMRLGFLPILDIAVLMLFLPREIWDLFYRKKPSIAIEPDPDPAGSGILKIVAQVTAGILLVYTLWWTLGTFNKALRPPAAVWKTAASIKLNATWNMFSPQPSRRDGWFIMAADLDDGRTVDLLRRGDPVDWGKPKDAAAIFSNYRYRKYMMNLVRKGAPKPLLGSFVGYHEKVWGKKFSSQGVKIREIRLYFMEERTMPDYAPPKLRKRLIWTRKS